CARDRGCELAAIPRRHLYANGVRRRRCADRVAGKDIPPPVAHVYPACRLSLELVALNALDAAPGERGRAVPYTTEKTMNRMKVALALGACAFVALAAPAHAADMALTRLDCGTSPPPVPVNQRFSDTYAYGDLKAVFVFSCYLSKQDN